METKEETKHSFSIKLDKVEEDENNASSSLKSITHYFNKSLIPFMKNLNLSFRNLKTVPQDITQFSSLTHLNLSHNRIKNFDGLIISKYIPNLVHIDISFNEITSIAQIQQLGHLRNLQSLKLEGNCLPMQHSRPTLIQHLLFFSPFVPIKPAVEVVETNVPPLPIENELRPSDNDGISTRASARSCVTPKLTRSTSLKQIRPKTAIGYRDSPSTPKTPKNQSNIAPRTPLSARTPRTPLSARTPSTPSTARSSPLIYKGNSNIPSTLSRKASHRYKLLRQASISRMLNELKESNNSQNDENNETHDELDLEKTPNSSGKRIPRSKIYARMQEEKKMRDFLKDFNPCDMNPFLESVDRLHTNMHSTREIVDRTRPCPVPRDFNTPFPMLFLLNDKEITIEEYLMAENEEIFDICVNQSHRKERVYLTELTDSEEEDEMELQKFVKPTSARKKRQTIEEKKQSTEEKKQPIEDKKQTTEEKKQSSEEEDEYIYGPVSARQPKIRTTKDEEDLLYQLRLLKKEKPDLEVHTLYETRKKLEATPDLALILDQAATKEYVGFEDYKNLPKSGAKKWAKLQSQLSNSLQINFGDVLRREFQQHRAKTNRMMGIKRKVHADFRPLKHQFLDMSKDAVLLKLERMKLNENIERWRNVMSYTKFDADAHMQKILKEHEREQRKYLHSGKQRKIREFDDKIEDEVVKFFKKQKALLKTYKSRTDANILAAKRGLDQIRKYRAKKFEGRQALRRELVETRESVVINGHTFYYNELFV